MEEGFVDKVLRWCRNQKVNLDLSVENDGKGAEVFLSRLRPWKQKKGHEIMWLGRGVSVEHSVKSVVTNYRNREEMHLDWALRPWDDEAGLGRTAGADEDPPF